jgi:cytochrome c biogenesis protein
MTRTFGRHCYEVLSSMRFAISMLTILAIASVIGTVLKQNEPYNAYLNQFGQFWFPLFESLGLYSVYHAGWFLAILVFLVGSTCACIYRQAPQMLQEMRSFREHAKESSLRQFAHQATLRSALPLETTLQQVRDYLSAEGFQARTNRVDEGALVAAKAGSWNRAGYILTHAAIVTICLGGLLDGDMPLKLQMVFGATRPASANLPLAEIPAQSRLAPDHWSYRGNVFLPEGKSSSLATVNAGDGILLQELPFELMLKKFHIDFYSTGAPKRFASDIVVIDKATGERFERTIEVNKPFAYKGVTLYQASFDDGGSTLQLKARSLAPGSAEALAISGEVGSSLKLTRRDAPLTLELVSFRPINVENFGAEIVDATTLDKLARHMGSGAKPAGKKDLRNVGPSIDFKLRDAAGQAREYNSYMLSLEQDGRQFFMAGVRESGAEPFRYMRIPADDDGTLDTWFALRALLTDPAQRDAIARRFTASAMKGDAISETMKSRLTDTAARTLELFASGGYETMDKFIRDTVPKAEQDKAAEVFVKVLQGATWEAWKLQREQQHLPLVSLSQPHATYVNDLLGSISDSFHYGAPLFIEFTGFEEIKASVIQATRSPGKYVVFLGCALLVAGVFCMLYIRERRLFLLIKDSGEVLLAMSANRKTLDFEEAFARHRNKLTQLLTEHDHGSRTN